MQPGIGEPRVTSCVFLTYVNLRNLWIHALFDFDVQAWTKPNSWSFIRA